MRLAASAVRYANCEVQSTSGLVRSSQASGQVTSGARCLVPGDMALALASMSSLCSTTSFHCIHSLQSAPFHHIADYMDIALVARRSMGLQGYQVLEWVRSGHRHDGRLCLNQSSTGVFQHLEKHEYAEPKGLERRYLRLWDWTPR